MNYTTQNDLAQSTTDEQRQQAAHEKLELFAEELPAQHDHLMYYTAGTLSTYGSTASSVSTLSTI